MNSRQKQIRRGNWIAGIFAVFFLTLTIATLVGDIACGHYADAAVYALLGFVGTGIGTGVILANS